MITSGGSHNLGLLFLVAAASYTVLFLVAVGFAVVTCSMFLKKEMQQYKQETKITFPKTRYVMLVGAAVALIVTIFMAEEASMLSHLWWLLLGLVEGAFLAELAYCAFCLIGILGLRLADDFPSRQGSSQASTLVFPGSDDAAQA